MGEIVTTKDNPAEPLAAAKYRDLSTGNRLSSSSGTPCTAYCAGDLHKEDRAWKHLFHAWLPRSGYEPTGDSTMEVYRRSPAELGWETFDNDCCLPVRPLRRR